MLPTTIFQVNISIGEGILPHERGQTNRKIRCCFCRFFLAAQFTRACIERIIQASCRFNLHTKYIAKKTEKKRINIHPQEIPAICKYWSNRTSNLVSSVLSLPLSREGPGDEVAEQDSKKN